MPAVTTPPRFAPEAKIQASEQRIPAAMRHDPLGSDNDFYEKCHREQWLLQQQTPRQRAAVVARFLAKVHKTATCWLWTASTLGTYGHGQFTIRDTTRKQHHLYAHRVAWVLSGRVIPPQLLLCHHCDVGRCVRPRHLFVGTHRDNVDDAIAKGRLVACGLGARKLSDDAYRDILTEPYEHGSGIALAIKHHVSKNTIRRIRAGVQGITYHRTLREVI